MTQQLESKVVSAILSYLRTLPNCCAEKTHGEIYGKGGKADITGCINGARFEFEVKRPDNPAYAVTSLQWKWLENWSKAGAICAVVTSVMEAQIVIERLAASQAYRSSQWLPIQVSPHATLPKFVEADAYSRLAETMEESHG
jgi:hypothetical protein